MQPGPVGPEHRRNDETRFWHHSVRGTGPWKHSERVTKTVRQAAIRTHKDWLRDERKRERAFWACEMELAGELRLHGVPREATRASGASRECARRWSPEMDRPCFLL